MNPSLRNGVDTDLRTRTIAQLAECLFLSGNTVKSLGDEGIQTIADHQFANGSRMTVKELEAALSLKEAAHRAFIEAQIEGDAK